MALPVTASEATLAVPAVVKLPPVIFPVVLTVLLPNPDNNVTTLLLPYVAARPVS